MGETNDILRVAVQADFPELMRLCRLLHEENGQHSWSEEKVQALVWRGLNRQNAIVGVIGSSSDIKAMILILVEPMSYSPEFQLFEQWNFVRKDARKSDFAKRMVEFGIRCSDETGLDLVIGVFSDIRLAAKQRLYRRILGSEAGFWYCHKPNRARLSGERKQGSNAA